jgi:dihydrofolate reductase
MRKIVAGAFVSLDGVMQAPGGPEEDPTGGFKFGGWTAPYWDAVTAEAMGDSFSAPFELLLGRKTYDIFAAHWPYIETAKVDPLEMEVARLFNQVTKYVATHSPGTLTWQNSQSLGKDVPARLRELKKETGPQLLIQGSSDLIQTLLTHDLIDEFRILIYPLVLGKGKRLFGDGTIPAAFKLTKSAVGTSGVLIATYERAGDIKTGSFAPDKPSLAEIERRKTLK